MFGIETLDVVIGLIFIYLLFSLLVSILNELLSQLLNVRAKELRFAIEKMIGYELRKILYQNRKIDRARYQSSLWYGTPLWRLYRWIRKQSSSIDLKSSSLDKKVVKKKDPSAISTKTFTNAIIEILEDEELRKELFDHAPFLKKLYDQANQDIEKIKKEVDHWYNEVMVYTSDWYKQKLRYVLFATGFVVAFFFNVDSIAIFQTLNNNPEARAAAVQQAESFTQNYYTSDSGRIVLAAADEDTSFSNPSTLSSFLAKEKERMLQAAESAEDTSVALAAFKQKYPTLLKADSAFSRLHYLSNTEINEISTTLGMGWDTQKYGGYWAAVWHQLQWHSLFGWLITALAISMGAPFWFDLLKKVINIKNEINQTDQEKSADQ
ncbi:MAG: hypothetical protein FH748_00085 [Balneolaceae bacterium]|nr:hypothetical protein [Balneolaceae bacterium]